MQAAERPYVMAGVALVGASLIAVPPIVSPADLPRVSNAAVQLTSGGTDLLAGLGDLGGLLASGSPLNIPYDLFINTLNIPYYESEALDEYAYALGPAGSVGGVPGWIPPEATVADGGVDAATGQYALGGTGSWWTESMGNTWGWDNGNWPQVDGLIHFLLPFQFTESLTEQLQSAAQSSLIDGSAVDCEFACSNVVGYLGGWLTHLGNLFSSTYPVVQTDTIGANSSTGVINVGPPDATDTAIWSGEPNSLNPLAPLEALWTNITESPAQDTLMPVDFSQVFTDLVKLGGDLSNDFDPFVTGSFAYWGAPIDYSIPALIGGLVNNVTLGVIPNEFANTAIGWPANGAEPLTGYTDGPASLLSGFGQGLQYLVNGLEGYLNPSTYVTGADGVDPSTLAGLLGDTSTLAGSLGDSSTLTSDLSSLLPNLGSDLASTLGPQLGTDLASIFPQLTADLSSWLPDLATSLIP